MTRFLLGKRGDLDRMVCDEGRLDQVLLNEFLEEEVDDVAANVTIFVVNALLIC